MSEVEWWEVFSDIATKQWELTPGLNRVVRNEYLQEMQDHLFRPGGRLLEIGCGSGWAGVEIARLGMSLTGIDTSLAQIERARRATRPASLHSTRFVVGTLSDLDRFHKYDSILIHAILHHMTEDDIQGLLCQAQELLNEGGRLYIYEPLKSQRANMLKALIGLLIFLVVWSPWWILHKIGITLGVGPPAFRDAVRHGWTGLSPDERPLEREWLLERLGQRYSVEKIRYWHAYSLALAMGCSELHPPFSWAAELVIRGLYWLDQQLLGTELRDYILGVWTFASICATVKETA